MSKEEVGAAMAIDAHSTGKDGTKNGQVSEACTVCDSVDKPVELEHTFQGVPHRFCSERCLRRFTEHPHLYVGSPQYGLSLKQQGKSIVKTHTIALVPCSDTARQQLLGHLQGLAGLSCDLNGNDLTVCYDLVRISLRDIEQEVQRVRGPEALKDTLTAKMRRRAIHFGEECELDNLAHLSNSGKQYGF